MRSLPIPEKKMIRLHYIKATGIKYDCFYKQGSLRVSTNPFQQKTNFQRKQITKFLKWDFGRHFKKIGKKVQ